MWASRVGSCRHLHKHQLTVLFGAIGFNVSCAMEPHAETYGVSCVHTRVCILDVYFAVYTGSRPRLVGGETCVVWRCHGAAAAVQDRCAAAAELWRWGCDIVQLHVQVLEHVQHMFVVLLPAARSGNVAARCAHLASTLQNASPSSERITLMNGTGVLCGECCSVRLANS